MNAAFILLTSAWMAGADPAPPVAPPAMAPAAPAVVATGNGCGGCGGCGSSCGDACCAEEHHRKKLCGGLGTKLKGKFNKGGHDACCESSCAAQAPTCCAPAPKPVCCAPAPKPVCCAPAPAPCAAPCGGCGDACGEEHGKKKLFAGLGGKLKGKFKKGGHDECCGGCDTGCGGGCGGGCGAAPAVAPVIPGAPGAAPAAPPAQKLPTTIGGTPGKIRIEEGTRNPFELARQYEGKANASHDYSKLTGQLFFVHTDGGRWVLRYAPISADDKFGGSVILTRENDMAGFKEGDLVTIEGEIVSEKTTLRLGGALYRANKITAVEKSQGTTAE